MEKIIAGPKRRSIAGRLARLGLSAALLSGGSWGVYHYTTNSSAGDDQSSLTARTASLDSASSANEQLKMLFAEAPQEQETVEKTSASPPKFDSLPAAVDRYASTTIETPAIPAELNTLAADPIAQIAENPFASVSTTVSTTASESAEPITPTVDRYTTIELPSEEPAIELPAEEAPVADPQIARGQNAGDFNPLRTSTVASAPTQSPSTNNQARAAFADQYTAPPSQPKIAPAKKFSPANALRNAQPLQPAAQSDYASGRYNGNQPTLAEPPAENLGALASAEPLRKAPAAQPTTSPAHGYGTPESAIAMAQPSYAQNAITPTPGLTNTPGTGRPGERLLEGVQSPTLTIQKLVPAEIQVGKKCTFAVRVRNTGQRATQNVQIHDEVPLGTELVGTAPRASVSGSKVVWDLGTLSVGEERTVEMELIPTEEGELGSVATVLVASQASAKARCTRPELALRLTCKPKVLAGQQHLVQIEITNPGSGDATGVMLLESIPAGVSHASGPALEFEIGTLRAGKSRRLDLMLSAEKAGKVDNVMTARADANLQVQASCQFEVIAPVLQVTVDGPQRRYLERPATYQVNVDNPGTASAKEVQLVTHLPKGMQFVSANNMGQYDQATHSIHWSLAELPANERGTVELTALPIEPGDHTFRIATKAQQGLEDQTEKHVTVEGLAALMFEVVDVDDPIEIGGETTYEIRVVNQGSKSAGNVQVVAVMPPGLRAISAQGETRHTIQGERVTFAPLPQLAPKADTAFRIQAQGVRPGDQRIRVQITTDEIRQPITKEESTHVYADQ